MNNQSDSMMNSQRLKISTLIGLLCFLVPLSWYALWIYAYNLGETQEERVAIFKSYFPEFLQGRWDVAYLSIAFCVLAITFCSIGLKLPGRSWKALNICVIVFSFLLLMLNIFSMM